MDTQIQYYSKTARYLHWIMAAIFILAWLIGFYSGNFLSYDNDPTLKGNVITFHKNIATTIIFLFILRILWRYTHPTPQLPQSTPPLQKNLIHIVHILLYIVLIALPISGCLFSWTAGHPAPVLYLFNLPQLLDKNPELVSFFKPLHIYLSWFTGFLILGHILAALKHHFIDRDHILKRMIG